MNSESNKTSLIFLSIIVLLSLVWSVIDGNKDSIVGNLLAFEGGQFNLKVSTTGRGYVSSSPSGIECGYACSESYSPGTVMTLTAKSLGDTFTEWGGDCSGTQPTCTLELSSDKTVTAKFGTKEAEPAPVRQIETPQPRPIVPQPIVEDEKHCCIDLRYNKEYALLTSCPTGFIDKGIQKDCNELAVRLSQKTQPTPQPAPMPPTQPPVATKNKYRLTVEKPAFGQIRSSDARINCPDKCNAEYEQDQEVILLTKFKMNENKAVSISLNQKTAQPPQLTCNPPESNPPEQLPVQPPKQTVKEFKNLIINPNSGKVVSTDGKLICPPTCKIEYQKDSLVDLIATPGDKFEGWGGDLTGTKCFPSKDNKCTIKMDDNKFVIAAFAAEEELSENPSATGVWRPYSEAIFYDKGGNNIIKPVTRKLQIKPDGTWDFGSTGTWEVKPIESTDWKKWGVASYGPTKKIVLNGWNNGIGDGPIEASNGITDFIWVIYKTTTPTLGPATVQIKFGR
ncbi:MAG: hypothetical protein HY363_04665 [Candidatus Aenigmarchaeota archaeon]|nr:hypothetical protein [Candidatus Aenigmarchaeota archaeon]